MNKSKDISTKSNSRIAAALMASGVEGEDVERSLRNGNNPVMAMLQIGPMLDGIGDDQKIVSLPPAADSVELEDHDPAPVLNSRAKEQPNDAATSYESSSDWNGPELSFEDADPDGDADEPVPATTTFKGSYF